MSAEECQIAILTDEENVNALDRSDLLYIVDAGTGLDLKDNKKVIVASGLISSLGDAEYLMCEGRAAPSGAFGSKLAYRNNSFGGCLRSIVSAFR